MTAPRTGCAVRQLYRDRHLCVGTGWTVTRPDGEAYELCSVARPLSFAVHGALPDDIEVGDPDRCRTEAPSGMVTIS